MGNTALHTACLTNDSGSVIQLLAAPGVDVNARDKEGQTPIMVSTRYCSVEALKLMLDDPRVDIDVRDKNEMSLEELLDLNITFTTPENINKCREMIKEEKNRRKNKFVEQEQKGSEDVSDVNEQDLEDVRANVRIQYVEKIDKVNQSIKDKEEWLKRKMNVRNINMRELRERQDLEWETLEKKLEQDKMKLEQKKTEQEQQLAELQQNLAETLQRLAQVNQRNNRYIEEMSKKQRNEISKQEKKYEDEDEKVQQELANKKEILNKLKKDLKNLDMDSEASTKDHKTIETARETLECPVCMEMMGPPTRIWMCPRSHIICEPCRNQIEGRVCPTCRTEKIEQRALIAEQFARTIFN